MQKAELSTKSNNISAILQNCLEDALNIAEENVNLKYFLATHRQYESIYIVSENEITVAEYAKNGFLIKTEINTEKSKSENYAIFFKSQNFS